MLTRQKSEIPHFPIIMLGVTILFTIATLLWVGFINYSNNKVLEHTIQKEFRALELQGLILENDQILMRYAQLAVATGDSKWAAQYDAIIPELSKLINEAILLAPVDNIHETVNKADLANQQLILLERQAFLHVKNGNQTEAKKIIASEEYANQQSIFREGMLKYNSTIQQRAKDYLQSAQQNLSVSIGVIIADFIFLIIAWIITFKNILSWKRELEEIIVAEMQYKKEIETARHFLYEMTLINKMNDRLQTCLELKEAYSIIRLTAVELFPDLSGGLCMRQKATNQMETVEQWGSSQLLKSIFNLDECWALREGHVYIVNNTNKGLICQHFDLPPKKGYLCLPLIVQDGVIGMVELNAGAGEMITDYQQQLAITFSEVLRLSIGNIKLRESLNEQAAHDPLTGLFNRRYLNETLPRELQRVARSKKHLCVAMLDIDYFKKINDAFGHEAGDEVLKFVSEQLKINLRASDMACRFGGEEFVIVLPDATLQDAMPHLQQICKEIKEEKLIYQKQALPQITVSIGVAEAPTNGNTAADIIRMADEALYKAKQGGRDRIEIFDNT